MNERRILIACPTLGIDPDPDRWLNSLMKILNNARREGFAHAIFCPYRQLWWDANNQIWDCAFSNGFDYILRIDDDVSVVGDDDLSILLAAEKDVIGAAYANRRFPYNVQALVRTTEDSLIDGFQSDKCTLKPVQNFAYPNKDIQKVDLIGFGMTLIKVAPFKFLERPMYKGTETCPDDSYFAQICLDNKIEQFVHYGVQIKHAHVTLQNAGHLYNADLIEMAARHKEEKAELENAKPMAPSLHV